MVVGLVATIADMATLYVLTDKVHIMYLVSAALGFIVGVTVNYVLSIRRVFAFRSLGSRSLEFIAFAIIGVVGLGLTEIILHVLVGLLNQQYMLAKVAAVVLVFAEHGIPTENVIHADAFSEEFLSEYKGSFDMVMSLGFIEHFTDVEKAVGIHLELLKPGGTLVVEIPNLSGINRMVFRLFNRELLEMHNLRIMDKAAAESVHCFHREERSLVMKPDKPHVCFISLTRSTYGLLMGESCSDTGGAELQQVLIANRLREKGYGISFVIQDFGQPPKVTNDKGIMLVKTCEFGKGMRVIRCFRWIRAQMKAMEQVNADIYYHRAVGPSAGVAAFFCQRKRKPFVYGIANNEDVDGSWKPHFPFYSYRMFQYGLTHATKLVAQTEDQVVLAKRNYRKDAILIRNMFAPIADVQAAEKTIQVLWVGAFRNAKRPQMYVDLAKRLPQYQFLMVGGPGLTNGLLFKEIASRAEGIRNVTLTGPVPYARANEYFSQAMVFVNTSDGEGFPNTYLQAWSRGVPVIAAFDADGIISRHDLGRHCSDVDSLAAAVKEFLENEELRVSAGERAKRYVEEYHDPASITEQYDQLFSSLYSEK